MNKIIGVLLIVFGVLVLLYFTFGMGGDMQQELPNEEIAQHFQEKMFEAGTADGLIPVEGFDSGLLLGKFPGLVPADFHGVQAFEGLYSVENGEVVFSRTQPQPVSSAERTVSEDGYRTLLANVAKRLSLPFNTEAEVEAIVVLLAENDVELIEYVDEEVGISFSYPGGETGYVLQDIEFDAGSSEDSHFVKGVQLIDKIEYEALLESDVPREGPPTISVMVFENVDNESASMWVDAHTSFSNIGLLVGEIDRDAVLAGANAVSYTHDGLYMNDVIVAASSGYIYMLVGSYSVQDAPIRDTFDSVVDSFEFIQIDE